MMKVEQRGLWDLIMHTKAKAHAGVSILQVATITRLEGTVRESCIPEEVQERSTYPIYFVGSLEENWFSF